MTGQVFLYVGAAITFLWGVSHLFPTSSVVKGFGDISVDNKNIITMEWIIEGIALIFFGIIVAGAAYIENNNIVSDFVFTASAAALIVLAMVSLFTGYRINFLPFKLCPFLFTISAILILIGMFL